MSEEPTSAANTPLPQVNNDMQNAEPKTVVLPKAPESASVAPSQPTPSFTLPKAAPKAAIPEAPKATFELPKASAPRPISAAPRASAPIPLQPMSISTEDENPSTISVALDFLAAAVAVAFAVLIILDI